MATAMVNLSLIGWGLIKNILTVAGITILCIGLFFGIRFVQKTMRKQKAFTINAAVVDLNGVVEMDTLAFVRNDQNGMLEMEFKTRKESIPPVPKHFIKNNWVMLLNYAPGHYAIIDTSGTIYNLDNGKPLIALHNLGMKKYITEKQREFLNKAETKVKNWDTYGPWITLGVAICAAVVLAWLLFYFGLKIDASNVANRLVECKEAMANTIGMK